MSRIIIIPETILLRNPVTNEPLEGPPIDFGAFVRMLIQDPKCTKTSDALFMVFDIRQKLLDKKVGDTFTLANSEWDKLKEVVKEPSSPHQAMFIQLAPYMRAILDAATAE